MPELPEVEIVKQSLEKTVKFKKIKKIISKNFSLNISKKNKVFSN